MSTSSDVGSERELPAVTVTDAAQQRILQVMQSKGLEGHSLRIVIQGRGPSGFQYGMTFAGPGDEQPEDTVLDAGNLRVLIDPDTLGHIRGATIDWETEGAQGGFQIDNPNPVWDDPTAQAVQQLLDEQINPAVAQHGGYVQLMDVQGDTAYVLLGGGCQGCGMVDVTLRQGIEVLVRDTIPEIRHVVDTTDHAGGTNPYYQPAKA